MCDKEFYFACIVRAVIITCSVIITKGEHNKSGKPEKWEKTKY
jgi:hypothetical protein